MTPETIGPHIIARPCPANPKDTSFTHRYAVGIMLLFSGFISRSRLSGETIVDKLGPYTSASKIATRAPIPAKVYARFTATVDFPMPPRTVQDIFQGVGLH